MQPLPPGDLSGLELVGCGGFGVVYRGRSTRLGMDIALKNTLRDSADDFKSLMKEKEMMAQANYPYVLRLLGLYETQGRTVCKYGLVMEYMPYGSICTLFDRIKEVPWALKFQILHQVALSMNYLHHVLQPPIIHRDLKPHNVLLNKALDVQLTDFGLAKNETSITLSQSMVGSLPYMPPEALQSYTCKPTKEFDVYRLKHGKDQAKFITRCEEAYYSESKVRQKPKSSYGIHLYSDSRVRYIKERKRRLWDS